MSIKVTKSLSIRGEFDTNEFLDWIYHRASVLDLAGWGRSAACDNIEIFLIGSPVLLEAFEMACSLGPGDALVDEIAIINQASISLPPLPFDEATTDPDRFVIVDSAYWTQASPP